MPLEIVPAYDRLDCVRALFGEYVRMLGVDLAFQNYDDEYAGLPGRYAPPDGRLFLARYDGRPAGCVALRRFDADACEMKRLYVVSECRGLGIGRALVERAIAGALEAGYGSMVLDTLASLENSVAIYRRRGFREIPAYYNNPHPEALYFQLDLLP